MKQILIFLLLLLFSITNLTAQNNIIVDSALWQPNGRVNKMKIMGDTLVIAGDFNLIGKNTPHAATFDYSSKLLNKFPHTNGEVKKAIPDGKNGFYVAGDFSKVGGKIRGGLAHINSSGQVTDFFKNQAINGYINDLEVKDSNLYIAGNFTGISEYTGGGALLNYDTNTVNFSFPKIEGIVYASEPDGEGGVYIGGQFSKVGEFYRENLAHIDEDGRVTAWNPKAGGEVRAIACNKAKVFVGGYFDYIGCEKRHKFASFEKGSNTPDTLQFLPSEISYAVFALEVYGGKLYVGAGPNGGSLSGGEVYAVNIATNEVKAWASNLRKVNAIKGMGGNIYIASSQTLGFGARLFKADTTNKGVTAILSNSFDSGEAFTFESVGDTLLVVGAATTYYYCLFTIGVNGSITPFDDVQVGSNVKSIALINDTIILCSMNERGENHFTAHGLHSKKRLNWNRNIASLPETINILGKNKIFCGGEFKTIGGERRENITALNINTSQVAKWKYFINREIHSIELADTSIYISGDFSEVNNSAKQAVARLFPKSATISSWNTNIKFGNVVTSKLKGDTIFIGGIFDIGSGYENFAALNRHTGNAYSFSDIKGGIQDFILKNNSLYILGLSNLTVNSIARNSIALVNAHTGALQSFNPTPSANFGVSSFALWKNNIVCGGYLSSFTSSPRIHIRILDATTGVERNNAMLVSDLVRTIAVTNDDKLFLGGKFMLADAKERHNIAMIDLKTGEAFPWNPTVNGSVSDIAIVNSKLYVGGAFTKVSGQTRNYLAAINLSDTTLSSWAPNPNSPIGKVYYSNGKIFIGGFFSSVNGQARKTFTSVDALTGQVSSLNPFSSATGNLAIYSISSFNNDVYVGGLFKSFNGSARNYFASFDGITNTLNSINLSLNQSSSAIIPSTRVEVFGNTVYVTGNFDKSGTRAIPGFVKFNATTKKIDTWAPNTNLPLRVAAQSNSSLFFMLAQAKINNKCRCNISILDTLTKKLLPWHPDIGLTVSSANIYGYGLYQTISHNNKAYMAGSFKRFNHEINNYLVGAKLEAIEIEQPANRDFCLGGEMNIKLITSGNFDTLNKFVLVLSDTLGNFSNPLYIDTIASKNDSFLYQIPKTLTVKNNYRLKVISTQPNLHSREEIFINILPEPKAEFTINDPYQCLYKNTFIFTNQSNIPGDVAWDFGDSSTGKRQTDFHAYKATGIYDARMVLKPYGNGCPNDTIIKQAEILPQPIPSFTINDTLQCNHIDSFVFTNTSTISRGSMTYLWQLDSTTTSIDTNTFSSYITTGVRTIALTATSDSGCVDSVKKDIEVINKPLASFSTNTVSQCLNGNSFEFTNTSPSSPYFSSKWYLGEADTSTSPTVTKSFNKDSTFIVKLLVLKDSACGDSALKSVIVNPNPIVSFSVDSNTKCQNDTFSFSSTTSINSGFIQGLSWDFGDGSISSGTSVAHNYSDSGSYTVTLIAASDSGCLDTANKKVVALAIPTTNFQINDSLQCFKTQFFQFTDLSIASGNDSIVSYDWDLGDTTFSTLKNPTHTYKDTGYYIVTLKTTSSLRCSDTMRLITAVAPEPQIDTIFGPLQVDQLDTNRYSIVNDTFTTYFWSVNNGNINLGSDSSYADINWDSVPTYTNTTIKVFPINDAGCFGDTAYLDVQISPFPVSITHVKKAQLKVYPNPAKRSIFISIDNDNISAGTVKVFDITGKEVLVKNFDDILHSEIEVNISKLDAGTYQIQFSNDNYKAGAKVIIITD